MSRGGAVAAFQVHVAGSQERAVRHKDLTVFQVAKSRTGDTRLVCCGQERLGRSAERVGLGGAARGGESCGERAERLWFLGLRSGRCHEVSRCIKRAIDDVKCARRPVEPESRVVRGDTTGFERGEGARAFRLARSIANEAAGANPRT